MTAEDGKQRLTDVATPETLLRLIQSVPSPKAEPIKLWLAKVGYERMQDMADPARSLDRAREYWQQHGRSEKWIQQRMMGQETRNKLTDYLIHAQGLKTRTPHLSISLTFRVTTTNPCAAAVAAMSESITGSFSPACSASPWSLPQQSAVSRSISRILPVKR